MRWWWLWLWPYWLRWRVQAVCSVRESWLEYVGKGSSEEGHSLPGSSSSFKCREACREKEDCKAFAFAASNGRCRLLSLVPGSAGAEWTSPGPESIVGIRWCPSERLSGENCWSAEVEPNRQLIGFAHRITDAATLAECADACRGSRLRWNFRCRSGIFYATSGEGNCILNIVTKENHPELFGPPSEEEEFQVSYFSMACTEPLAADHCEGRLRTLPGYLQGFELAEFRNISRDECQRRCLRQSLRLFPFVCKSFNYYRSRRLCTLSPEDKDSEPLFFWDAGFTDNTLYVDLKCANHSSSSRN